MHSHQQLPKPYIKKINGVTLIDVAALEESIKGVPAKDRLRQKMINAGVEFWDQEQTIIKKPVVGIYSIGGLSICLDDVSEDKLRLYLGAKTTEPLSIMEIIEGQKVTMGMQSSPTYMNPQGKSAQELFDVTTKYKHYSMAHAVSLGVCVLGLSTKAELEFDSQRDLVHLARETSARCHAQDEPTLVALSEIGARFAKQVRENTTNLLKEYDRQAKAHLNKNNLPLNWLEERNALFPKSAAAELIINGTDRNLQKMLGSINDNGKEIEYRNILALLNDSLHAMLPQLYKATAEYGHKYPEEWQAQSLSIPIISSKSTLYVPRKPEAKRAILLLGAPGIGKTTQTTRIVNQMQGVMCVSTGSLVRRLNDKIKTNPNVELTEAEKKAAKSLELMRQGKLMDPAGVYALLMAHLSPEGEGYAEYKKSHTIILDGAIKAHSDIVHFEAALAQFNQQATTAAMQLNEVINIQASEQELIGRQQARVDAAAAKGEQQRPDDDPEKYKQRLKRYTADIAKVLEHYENKDNLKLTQVNGEGTIDDTTQALINAINKENKQEEKKLHVI